MPLPGRDVDGEVVAVAHEVLVGVLPLLRRHVLPVELPLVVHL